MAIATPTEQRLETLKDYLAKADPIKDKLYISDLLESIAMVERQVERSKGRPIYEMVEKG